MRERHGRKGVLVDDAGITPARAGKTGHIPGRPGTVEDHPRSCGKDMLRLLLKRLNIGSPPLVRERLGAESVFLRRYGITPARAGKTASLAASSNCSWDHPRSCGKDSGCRLSWASPLGSPPLVRERQ